MARILVISPNWIGDAVMAQPLLRLLRERYPKQPIDVLTPMRIAPVWRAVREVDTVIESSFASKKLQWRLRWRCARQLRRRGYSAAYVLPNTFKFALIPWFARIPRRIGYRGELRYGLINVMHHDDPNAPRPMTSFYAALASAPHMGALDSTHSFALPNPKLYVTAEQLAQALTRSGLSLDAPLIALAPGAEFGSAKRWPPAYFAELAHLIRAAYPNAQIVLLGANGDKEIGREVSANAAHVHNLIGATKLEDAIALLSHVDALISNDSGLLHIAAAFNRPVLGLYGSTDPNHAPPLSDFAQSLSLRLACAPCRQRECPLGHHACMRQMTADKVWERLRAMLHC